MKFGRIIFLLRMCLLRIVVITVGVVSIRSSGWVYSGLINEDEAPVSIKNFKGRPKGEEIFIYGKMNPCLLTSKYPIGLLRLVSENFRFLIQPLQN